MFKIEGTKIQGCSYCDKCKLVNIKNLKNEFRKSTRKYLLSDKDELLYKRTIKYKNKITNITESKDLILKVPTVQEFN